MKIFETTNAPRSFVAGVVSLLSGTFVLVAAIADDLRAEKPRGYRFVPVTLQHPRRSVRWSFLDPLI
ncbi:hypothetical protein E1161_19045 [Saccharopolyspora aridisoli]|uniref:Uncharacterized protein n=1 Tax=Saccharopolyspora aridisoli TaxID=2530385 RepID=A0A4R4UFB5_9PSEU|nr:hypothetical protein [Saccharopolyspora aridisoli]TDC90407.1 hypothetical protein E1161_19045 [Saccharopolyspora aridisoli]